MRLIKFIDEDIDWKKYTDSDPMLKAAKRVLDKIASKGYRCYIVGGTVRDIILGEKPHDVDFATNMPMDEIEKIWKTHDIGKNKEFGIIVIQEGGFSFELAQFRKDSYVRIKGVRKILN